MRRHRRRNKKNKKIIAITVVSVCFLLVIMVAGYAAMQTNIGINAKGNVVENATGGEALLEMVDVVTEGDGLYADTYEEGRYIYKGANPNNYITFSGETWRIISVENDNTIKIMRAESIGDMAWDSTGGTYGSNNWARPADLNTYLNGEYLGSLSDADKIVTHNFGIGAVTGGNNDLADQINDENGTTWNSKVGLITVSEYLRANTNTTQCGTLSLNNDNYDTCKDTNWIFNAIGSRFPWTISPNAGNIFTVFLVLGATVPGTLGDSIAYYSNHGVVPVLYLSSDITLQGEGTSQAPYTLG